ncbi:MAG TPA: T9SS type A sorting domain-containing protein [Chitinophagales bacterium]|nr:T9SS type A sorting domain-containing protein [Chitinophagales bacterium]HLP49439.1 T9SS type A sorting domain-containing protein [Chitinophagales bacterium]
MKKVYTILAAMVIGISASFAGAGCTIDPSNTQFFSPAPDSIPCIERGQSYTQIIQVHVPETIDVGPMFGFPAGIIILAVDSMQIDSVTGFPTGLNYAQNPPDGFYLGGDNGCINAYGTTNDPVGNYPLTVHGTISVSGIPPGFGFPSDTSFQLDQGQGMSGMFSLGVDVINPGDECRPAQNTGINSFSADLNSLMQVVPNPNNGVFELRLNAGRRVEGEVVIVDVTGRKVYSQAIDAVGMYSNQINLQQFGKGLYTLQLRTANGFASKNISID